jgi:hypothetical protein
MFSPFSRLLTLLLFAAAVFISPFVYAQNKPAGPSITVYKTPT